MSDASTTAPPPPVAAEPGRRRGPAGKRGLAVARRHPVGAAAALYAVLSVLVFLPGFLPGRTLSASDLLWTASPWSSSVPHGIGLFGANREQADAVQVFQPFLDVTRRRLPDVPLWNPYVMLGRPYVGNAQSAVFSPFNVPGYVLGVWRGLAPIAALKLFVAAFGMFLLARALALRYGGALLAGLVFGFSLWMVTWVSWPTVSVWAFMPWLALLTEQLIRRPRAAPFAGLAVVVALQYFGGHPESSFHALLLTALYWLVRVLAIGPRDPRTVGRRAAAFAGALVAGTLLAALAIVPFLELLHRSVDLDIRAFFGPSHADHRYLFGLFLHDYWGRQTRTPLEFPSAMEEHAYYLGALTLALAAAALVLRPTRQRAAFAVIGAVALAVTVGIPPFFGLITTLPGFNTAHNSRLAVIFVFCAALLAGWGLDDLTRGPWPARRRRMLAAGAVALLLFPLAVMVADGTLAPGRLGAAFKVAWLFQDPPAVVPPALGSQNTSLADLKIPAPPASIDQVVRLASLLEWLVLAGLAAVLLVLRLRGRLGATTFVVLALALVTADLFKAGVGYNPGIPVDHADPPATGALRYLQARGDERFAALDATHAQARLPPLPPDVGMRYGLYDARGYDYPIEKRFDRFWHGRVAGRPECLYAFCPQTVGRTPRALRSLGLLGVQHLLQDRRDVPLADPRARLVYDGPDARVYANGYAVPHAYLVGRQQAVAGENQAFAAVTAAGFDPRATAVTEAPVPSVPAQDPAASPAPAGAATIERYEDERVVVRARARAASLLVLTDSWAPGWKATVDGRDAEVRRVDYLVRGVAVPAGRHRVELRYAPASWRAGWITSLVALLALGALVVLERRRARGRPPRSP